MAEAVVSLPLLGTAGSAPLVLGSRAPLATSTPAFVAGPENRLLAAVLIELITQGEKCELPATLLLLGAAGSGKTLLAQGLARQLGVTCGASRVALITASDFRRQLADAADEDRVGDWRAELRDVAFLIIDDLDHLTQGSPAQQELIATIDAIAEAGGRVIATSQQPLGHMIGWEPGIASRLHGGLVLEIDPPSFEARCELVRQMLLRLDWTLDSQSAPDLIAAIAENTSPEPPLIARCVAELQAKFPGGRGATIVDVEKFLSQQLVDSAPSLQHILQVVARYYRVPRKQITSGSRRQEVVQARAMVITLARQLTPISYEQIGMALGGRDHTTMLHHHRKIEQRLPTHVALRSAYNDLVRLVQVP